jgi:GTP-binding protein YchF
VATELRAHLDDIKPVSTFARKEDENFQALDKELRFLSNKTIIYGANVDEAGLLEENEHVKAVKEHAKAVGADVVVLCAKVEEEMIALEEDEAEEFLKELGIEESGLKKIIRLAFDKLGLASYFTAGVKEVRAWTIEKGWKAPKAAAVIHNDFEKGFIRAEVISYNDFIAYKGEAGSKEAGKMRLEGKEYVVQDGDVMHFRFNV